MTVRQVRFDGTDAPHTNPYQGQPVHPAQERELTEWLTRLAKFDRDSAKALWKDLGVKQVAGELDRAEAASQLWALKKVVRAYEDGTITAENLTELSTAFSQVPAQREEEPVRGPLASKAFAAVPEGRYAVDSDAGHTLFVMVKRYESGAYVVLQQISDDFNRMSKPASRAVMGKIFDQGVKESAIRYGKELGVCGVCNRTLTNPESRAAGIGPKCAASF